MAVTVTNSGDRDTIDTSDLIDTTDAIHNNTYCDTPWRHRDTTDITYTTNTTNTPDTIDTITMTMTQHTRTHAHQTPQVSQTP